MRAPTGCCAVVPIETDLADHPQDTRNEVARLLNSHPRKTQNYETPAGKFSQAAANLARSFPQL
jgi:IS30 family transposase